MKKTTKILILEGAIVVIHLGFFIWLNQELTAQKDIIKETIPLMASLISSLILGITFGISSINSDRINMHVEVFNEGWDLRFSVVIANQTGKNVEIKDAQVPKYDLMKTSPTFAKIVKIGYSNEYNMVFKPSLNPDNHAERYSHLETDLTLDFIVSYMMMGLPRRQKEIIRFNNPFYNNNTGL